MEPYILSLLTTAVFVILHFWVRRAIQARNMKASFAIESSKPYNPLKNMVRANKRAEKLAKISAGFQGHRDLCHEEMPPKRIQVHSSHGKGSSNKK